MATYRHGEKCKDFFTNCNYNGAESMRCPLRQIVRVKQSSVEYLRVKSRTGALLVYVLKLSLKLRGALLDKLWEGESRQSLL